MPKRPTQPANLQIAESAGTTEQGDGSPGLQNQGPDRKEKSPDEKMGARFPQPTKVGHLIGLPVLDFDDSTIGYVREVVRTSGGKVRLIVPFGKHLGWAHDGWLIGTGRRLVAVPIEAVAILALQIDALDMSPDDFDKAPTWRSGQDRVLPPDETISIAIARR